MSAHPHEVIELLDRDRLADGFAGHRRGIAYGMGRSYGDACLNPGGTLWSTSRLDRLIAFDDQVGRLACESGVLLRDIQRLAIPRGWSLPVLPGTQMVTVGGAIANDVHGKNHHAFGTFGEHVTKLRLVRTDGETIDASPGDAGPGLRPDWFAATVGGVGLTGVIAQAELQLRRVSGPWLEAETIAFEGLDEFFALSDGSERDWEHAVSWIDCRSAGALRGLFMRARPAGETEGAAPWRARTRRMPLTPPVSLVNGLTLRPLNALYFHLAGRRAGPRIVHYEPFLCPLDSLLEWNRLYGPRGFFQYQSVVPQAARVEATREMLDAVARSGEGSFLAVLKTFGDRPPAGLMSFPAAGVTLALDFPNRRAVPALFERLDAIVREAGGRLYLAKDARMPRSLFEATYPNLAEFARFRDPGTSSAMSQRLMGS
ncbi:MAG: FAD-binding oxidoreductase [Reyranella sp.]|nr:FAD-binding oxidoreductase [Reyranella sp.]MDP3163583.1 FAD-binding oxidoreductase [Reyranella sp.]